MSLYRRVIRPLLFRVDPETAHHATVNACRLLGRTPGGLTLARLALAPRSTRLQTEVAGLRFENPIGLAAGWDKSGVALRALDHLGFGFVEIGSVSARPSVGNPRPRLFRLPDDQAIVVNYGLPNDGADVVARRLAPFTPRIPLGVNVVKTNDGPDALACSESQIIDDYHASVTKLHRHADYLTLNLSCPNAEGGKDHFALPGRVTRLLERLADDVPECPVFLKVAPDPDPGALENLLEQADPFPFVRGWIFNLAPGKPDTIRLKTSPAQIASMPGAVAGMPVAPLINRCIAEMAQRAPAGRYTIIGAGGIFTADDAYEKIRLGASLVQLYSALIYEGPGVIKRIHRSLCRLLERDGFRSVAEAVGTHPSRHPSPNRP